MLKKKRIRRAKNKTKKKENSIMRKDLVWFKMFNI